jgi:hypothetical protein
LIERIDYVHKIDHLSLADLELGVDAHALVALLGEVQLLPDDLRSTLALP